MALVGTLLFCTDCGDLLERADPAVKSIVCQCCNASNPNKWPVSIQTSSKPDAFPSILQSKRSDIQTLERADIETWAKTSETCPSCSGSETRFREMRLRSADEGSTVFFQCTSCSHMWKLDN